MRLGFTLSGADLLAIPRLAREAEALGVQSLWSTEGAHNPFLPLALAAEHTTGVQLGTAIAVAFARSPVVAAHVAWVPAPRLARPLRPRPRYPGQGARRAALRHGIPIAGMNVHPFNSVRYLRELVLPSVGAGLARAGRTRADVSLAAPVFVITGRSADERREAREAVRRRIAFYGSTRTYQPVLDVHGWGDLSPRLHEASMRGDWSGMASLVTDEMLAVYAVGRGAGRGRRCPAGAGRGPGGRGRTGPRRAEPVGRRGRRRNRAGAAVSGPGRLPGRCVTDDPRYNAIRKSKSQPRSACMTLCMYSLA
jgi:alkanesulfonate monooxygenase SsuD/methylene tetrahydromethanopterin reductase-like flavin-dependent oxidoreductase (luciferase family)